MTAEYHLLQGDCLTVLPRLKSASVDLVLTDPPYPEVERDYGRLSVDEWWALMRAVISETRRVLKPSGSAVFVLQPNSERHGRVRPWFFEFLAEYSRDWNMVQDAWWWNWGAMPLAGCARDVGLMRGSLKACAWFGAPDCWRDQGAVLWETSDSVKALQREGRAFRASGEPSGGDRKQAFRVYDAPDGKRIDKSKIMSASLERGGVTPFNVLPLANTDSANSGGAWGHPAATPAKLAAWWVRYACPPGGVVLDPFSGSGTVVIEAARLGRRALGIEAREDYHRASVDRAAAALGPVPQ